MNRKTRFSIVFTSISILLLATVPQSCQNPPDPTVTEPRQPTEAAEKSPEKNTPHPTLSDENIEDFLRDYGRGNTADNAVIHTPYGDITIRLFRDTPLHRASFLYLAEQQYFDGTWFYRVSPGHVIQAGNNDERETVSKRKRIGEYSIPPELNRHFHGKGAVAAVRSYKNNPDKRSDPFEFYIVLGESFRPAELNAMEDQYEIELNAEQREIYSGRGGSPHLDGEHTVFGEVIEGMAVVQKINMQETDEGEWPLKNIPIEVKIFR